MSKASTPTADETLQSGACPWMKLCMALPLAGAVLAGCSGGGDAGPGGPGAPGVGAGGSEITDLPNPDPGEDPVNVTPVPNPNPFPDSGMPGPTLPDGGVPLPPPPPGPPLKCPQAADLAIEQVAIYQTTKIVLARNGKSVDLMQRETDVVAGRKSAIRVFVERGMGFQPRTITAQLTILAGPSAAPETHEQHKMVTGDSTDRDGGSTFNFKLPGETIGADTRLSIELLEGTPCTVIRPNIVPNEGARWPAVDLADLGARQVGALKVVIVPIRYDTDGSMRLPDTSPAEVEKFKEALLATYPISATDLTVHAPMKTMRNLGAQGTNWSTMLDSVLALRRRDMVADDVFYYGLIMPAESARAYCSGGCVAGIAPEASRNAVNQRGALGLGFSGNLAIDTFLHELGHATGRAHSPCGGASRSDPKYPDPRGGIVVWGFDSRSDKLLDPKEYKDIMSYCDPTWFSAYTYQHILERIAYINNQPFLVHAGIQRYRVLVQEVDGELTWGRISDQTVPDAPAEWASVLDAKGAPVTRVQVYRQALEDVDGAFIYVPEPDPSWHAIQLAGRAALEFERRRPEAQKIGGGDSIADLDAL